MFVPAGYLAGVRRESGGHPQFRQDICLQQEPDTHNPQKNQYFFHCLSLFYAITPVMSTFFANRPAAGRMYPETPPQRGGKYLLRRSIYFGGIDFLFKPGVKYTHF
jgi:hypothetical protein